MTNKQLTILELFGFKPLDTRDAVDTSIMERIMKLEDAVDRLMNHPIKCPRCGEVIEEKSK